MKKNLLYVLMSLVMLCTVLCFSTTAVASVSTAGTSQTQLKITKQLKSASAYKGKKIKLTVKAKGEGLKYTWYFKDKGAKSFKKTDSFKGNTYTLEMSSKNSGRQVYCKITDKYGNSTKTKTATLTMRTALKVTAQPESASAYSGKSIKLTVKAKGDGLKYTWYYKDKGSKSFKKTDSFKSNTYTLKMSSKNNGRQVYCKITDKYGSSVKTSVATLTTRTTLKISTQSESASAYSGENIKLTVKAKGDGLKYTWYYKDKGSKSFKKTDSFKSNTYTLKMSSKNSGRQVYCKITDKYGSSVKTSVATLTTRTTLKITTQPSSAAAYSGAKASVKLKAAGDGLKYTWYYKDKSASSFKKTDTFKSTSYTIEMSSKNDGRQVYCVVTDKYGSSVQSGVATLYVKKATAAKTCETCQLKNGGTNFDYDYVYTQENKINCMPLTYQAVFTISKEDMTGDDRLNTLDRFHNDKEETAYTESAIISNDDTYDSSICISVTDKGNPALNLREKDMYIKFRIVLFDKVNVFSDKPVQLTITIDHSAKKAHCYVNGKLMQSKTIPSSVRHAFVPTYSYAIGGDLYSGNPNHFRGQLYSVGMWSDIRTKAEIERDYLAGIDTADSKMLAYYDLTNCTECMTKDLSPSGNNLNTEKLWLTKDEVEPVGDYDYAIAVIGDTQELSEESTEEQASSTFTRLYDWLVENKDEQKIEYVIGLGDITQKSYAHEWKHAKEQIYKLNDKIPYLLTRGNHDYNRYDDEKDPTKLTAGFNMTFDDGVYNKQLTGVMREGDLSNAYRVLNVCGVDYLFITLDFGPEKDVLEWAGDIVEQYPTHKVIIATHGYLYRDGTTLDADDAYSASKYPLKDKKAQQATNPSLDGDDIWEQFASKYENIQLVLSGHDPCQHVIYRKDKGEKGNVVTQMLIDPQHIDSEFGLTAFVAMFYFSNEGNTLTVRYYSVIEDKFGSERSQFTINLNDMN